ncbi:inner capsid protein [African horse sickness virus 5]|uniref:Core protein VP7 n=3 Tax=African horse sickness virus TaxID=40050 RepID=A0A0N7CXA3_AHSV5|nr:VP7 [African horse sickness virus]AKP19831.1 VP7 [African horse sickness virus 5]ALL99646.1 inner capsid protein [African horse sickness virus 4]ALL99653.1 inner capsid protein [African horse sickness virus 5]ALL99655.1 inner capsid protein [African horse sickness virus 5]
MDAIAARALSVVRACVTVTDARVSLDPGVMETLGIAINRYNGLTNHSVSMRPQTQVERNEMFFMCTDMVLAALNVQIGNISPDYDQALATVGALATTEIPYNVQAMNDIVRITGQMQTFGPSKVQTGPYAGAAEVQQSGRYYVPQGRTRGGYINSNIAEVCMDAGAAGQVNALLTPRRGDAVMVYFVWRPLRIFCDPQGASLESAPGTFVTVDGVNVAAGDVVAWNTIAPVNVGNPGARRSILQFEVLWYTSLDRSLDTVPELAPTLTRCYAYVSPTWHALRAAIFQQMNMQPINPPIFPPTERNEIVAYLLVASLADVYAALRPDFRMNGVVAPVGQINRALVLAAYH